MRVPPHDYGAARSFMGRYLISLCTIALLAVGLPASARDALAGQAAGVEDARRALSREAFPWYDQDRDSLRRVHLSPPENVAKKSGEPEANPSSEKDSERDVDESRPQANWTLGSWGDILAIVLVAAMFFAIAWFFIRAYLTREEQATVDDTARIKHTAVDDAARIEALPFRIRRGELDLLAEARRLYEETKFSEAIVYLFSYQLVELDRHQVIRLSKGKTNRRYLRELGRQPALRSMLERSMVAFEEVFFGGHALGRAQFETVWHEIGPFTAMLARQERA